MVTWYPSARYTNIDPNFSAFALFFLPYVYNRNATAVGIELGLVVKAKDHHIRDMHCKCWVPP